MTTTVISSPTMTTTKQGSGNSDSSSNNGDTNTNGLLGGHQQNNSENNNNSDGNTHTNSINNNNNNNNNQQQFPPNHPLSGSKHLCSICEDRASGKHYGVYSCEGCKGFFKRTVRKNLTYACREDANCVIDKRQRNRCQYCRYQKCLSIGMKREAVQEERQRSRDSLEVEVESSNMHNDIPLARIVEAEVNVDRLVDYDNARLPYNLKSSDPRVALSYAAQRQIRQLIDWAKNMPKFTDLLVEDQLTLLKTYWNELMIAELAFRSVDLLKECVKDCGLFIGQGIVIFQDRAHDIGLHTMFERVITEIVSKMYDMRLDKTELACLRAIILFNPETQGLKSSQPIEDLRGNVFTALETYCRNNHENQPNRFGKLLLRLPALRSIGLKCDEKLLFVNLCYNGHIDTFLLTALRSAEVK